MEAIHFLHSNYFDMEEAKKTAENYYTYRTQFTELFTGNDVNRDEMQQAHKTMWVNIRHVNLLIYIVYKVIEHANFNIAVQLLAFQRLHLRGIELFLQDYTTLIQLRVISCIV